MRPGDVVASQRDVDAFYATRDGRRLAREQARELIVTYGPELGDDFDRAVDWAHPAVDAAVNELLDGHYDDADERPRWRRLLEGRR